MRLVSLSPASGTLQVLPNSTITAKFSKTVNAASVASTSFKVVCEAEISGSYAVANATVVFTHAIPFAVARTCSINLSTAIQATDGAGLEAAVTSTFSVDGIESFYTFYGGAGAESVKEAIQVGDGGYVSVGYGTLNIPTLGGKTPLHAYNAGEDGLILKTDYLGNLEWYAFFGSGSNDRFNAVSETADGGYLVAGYAGGNVATYGGKSPNIAYAGLEDGVVVKYSKTGQVEWYTLLGVTGVNDRLLRAAATPDGGAGVGGFFAAAATPLNGQSAQYPFIAGNDAVLLKLNSAGIVQFWSYYNSSGNDQFTGLSALPDNSFIACGFFDAAAATVGGTARIATLPFSSGADTIAMKISSTGAVQWFGYYGNTQSDECKWIKSAPDGGYVFSGYTGNPGYAAAVDGKTVLQGNQGGTFDATVFKLTATGNVDWFTHLGGSGDEFGNSISVMLDGKFAMGGQASVSIPTMSGISPGYTFGGGGNDGLLVILNSNGSINSWTNLGGTGAEGLNSIFVSSDGGLVTGSDSGANVPTLGGQLPRLGYNASGEVLLFKLRKNGLL